MLVGTYMTHTLRIVGLGLVWIALTIVALLSAPSSSAQELSPLPLFAVEFAQSQTQSSTPAQSPPSGNNNPGQNSGDQNSSSHSQATESQKKNDRMFFVMPNFLTVQNEAQVKPLNWKGKFAITADGAFDPYEFVTAGILAGVRQAENSYPAFGQGFVGYAKRYGTAFADQVDGNMMVGAVFPSILRTDPRYFAMGRGSFSHRFGYALSRIFITRKDSGGEVFNVSEVAGNGVAIGISNFYYPAADRGVSSNLDGWGLQMAIDALGNELKEFWPDIHRRIEHARHRYDPDPATVTP
jgi:hypothetical protein